MSDFRSDPSPSSDIDQHLETASIILLLISPDFLASDYCYEIEMQRALERHKCGEARVIPIIVRPVDWHSAPFGHLQCLPRDGKAVTIWQNPDEALLAIAQGLRRIIEKQRIPTHPLPEVERKNRRALIKRVQTTWIEGLLEHSLHEAARLELRLQERPDALANPWRLQVQELDRPPQPLPVGTSIVQVYDEAEGELLILGKPGSGKTTLLLELARDLLARAKQDDAHPIPVVFNLSSWATKRQSIIDWLVEELRDKYYIHPRIGRPWIEADQILPLLDGLDEVHPKARAACVDAINSYRKEHGLLPTIVCSRGVEYDDLAEAKHKLQLHSAVVVQPLTAQQIDDYLWSAAEQLEGVRVALREDKVLQELATTPLMLSVLTLAYQGKPVEDLLKNSSPKTKQQVFATYIQQMLERRGVRLRYTKQQTVLWLAWLARQMKQHNQTEFHIDRMQPDWLSDNRSVALYHDSVAGLVAGLYVGVYFGVVSGLVSGLGFGVLSGLLSGLSSALLVSGLAVGLRRRSKTTVQPAETIIVSRKAVRRGLVLLLAVGLIVGLGFGLVYGPYNDLAIELGFGLYFTACSWLIIRSTKRSVILQRPIGEIRPHIVTWSGQKMRRSLVRFLALGLVCGLLFGVASAVIFGPSDGLIFGLSGGVFLWLAGLLKGVSRRELDEFNRVTPNQGIWLSLRNSLLLGLISGLFLGLAVLIIAGLTTGLITGLTAGLITGLTAGLLFGLGSGGLACIQHVLLRLLLWSSRSIPWNYPHFLDYATERILLRKVGGGYIFVHRLLLDYFASLEKNES